MGILKNNQKVDVRFEKGDFKIYEPNELQREEIMKLLEKQDIKIEGEIVKGEVDLKFIRFILRECTSIGNEVDEYDDKELEILFENGNREMQLFMREIERLINELVEDLLFMQEKEVQLILKMLNILNTTTTKIEMEKKFNNLMKKNKVNLTLQQMIENKDNPEELQKLIKISKRNNGKKK